MFHSRTVFAILCSGYVCVALPALNHSRETMVDANEPLFPTVNIIADHINPEFAKTYEWGSAQDSQRSLLDKSAHAQQRFEASSVVHLEVQNRQLDNLRGLSARISDSALDVKQAHH